MMEAENNIHSGRKEQPMFARKDFLDLSGKTAVVTGAGSGIGLAVADMLSTYGASVAIVDVNPAGED